MYIQRWPLLLLTIVSPVASVALWDGNLQNRTLDALKKAAVFYEKHFLEINLDSLFGLRAAEGVLHKLVENREVSHHEKQLEISRIYTSIKNTSTKTLRHFRHGEGGYYHAFKSVIMKEWYYQAKRRQVSPNLIRSDNKEDLDESISDLCLTGIMGSQWNESNSKCSVSDDCWWWMSQIGATGYYLTHQALFFILADVTGCTRILGEKFQYDKEKTFTRLGTNIFIQMRELSTNVFQDTGDKDLFLEQALICKWLGIQTCLQDDWLRLVLSWQHPSGCVKDDDTAITHVGMRRLNVEKVLSNGCSAHATGLFIAYLATAFRWLITEHTDSSSLIITFSRNVLKRHSTFRVISLFLLILTCLIVLRIFTRRRCRLLSF